MSPCGGDRTLARRDLKTANIFLAKGNLVKIGDFGISKMMGTQTKHLGANTILGTPYYLSPEMVSTRLFDAHDDECSARARPTTRRATSGRWAVVCTR